MDNRGTCSLKNKKKMDANTIWQWRIMRVKKYSRRPEPFHCSNKIGLDFNVASNTQKKLDLQLVTNGVILEVCDFAKTVNKSKRHFITNILENNFNLGLENQQQRIDFTARILHKVKDLIRKPPKDKHEYFTLFDMSSKQECNSNNGLNMTSIECKTKSFLVEMDGAHTDDSEDEGKFKCSQATSNEYLKTESLSDEMDEAHADDSEDEDEFKCSQATSKAYIKTESLSDEMDGAHADDSEDEDEFKCSQATSKAYIKTESLSDEMDGAHADDSEDEDEFKCSQATSKEYIKTECLSDEMDGAHADDSEDEDEFKCSRAQSTAELKEDVPPPSFPYCEEIGLNLDVGSKQSLDPGLLTKGVMLELVHFTRVLTASYSPIVLGVLEHNFELDLKSQRVRNRVWFKISHLLKRRKRLITTGSKITPEFKNEPFSFKTKPFNRPRQSTLSNMGAPQYQFKDVTKRRQCDLKNKQEKRALLTTNERVTKRHRRGESKDMDTNTFSHHTDLCTSGTAEVNHRYTCPLGESDLDSDKVTSSGNTGNQDYLQNPTSSDIPSESESSYAPFPTPTKVPSSLPTVDPNVNPLFGSQPDKRGLCGGEVQTQTPRNAPNECHLEQEEMGTENNYTCPLGESDIHSDEVTDSGSTGNQNHVQTPKSCSMCSDIPRESESSCLGICAPVLAITDVSSSLPTVNPNVNPLFASQPDKGGLCGGEEETQTPRNAPIKCDMEQNEIETKNNMWKLRANRVKQILSTLNKEFCSFNFSKKFGLKFNVGFGPKQNISVDSLTNSVLLELAKFALAINSSQQDFIMEILEYNFDFGLQSQHHRNLFTCEIMNRVSQLRSCEDAVKFSNEVFEIPGPMPSINMSNQSVGRVNAELRSISRTEEGDVAPVCHPYSHAGTKEHISRNSVDLCPFCKEIGLKLHVNNSQPNKKLDINKLTNGAMTEVTNFAEKLCGTFEQICLDILGHNFDLDLQSGDSELARNILARIPAAIEQKNLSTCINAKCMRNDFSVANPSCQNNPNLDACSAGSPQSTIIDQNEGSSPDTEHQNELNLKLWKLRTNRIQQILSVPHEEHCPLYSYSRCKKSGINFNVGSGVKQNLDPKLLTNGIMVELSTFATALLSTAKPFITEILEYNFNLNLKNELDRSAFAQETLNRIRAVNAYTRNTSCRMKLPFELPDMRCIQEPTHDKTTYCPKCYQDRNHKLRQDESDPGHMNHSHPHAMTDTVSADANCTAQKPAKNPSSTFSTTEETIMDSYPRCKKIGLNLCVDKDQPKDKLDTHVLTRGIMSEVSSFAKKLCGTKNKIIKDLLEHNFNIDLQSRVVNPKDLFRRAMAHDDGGLAWFSEVFAIQSFPHIQPGHVSKRKQASAMQRSEMKETIKKRKLALQAKEEKATLPSHNISKIKSKTYYPSKGSCYPICTEIGLDLDVTSKSGGKEKLDLKLLTRAVVLEIHKFATQKVGHYFPHTLFDILDYNFDLSSQNYRRWEFSIATAFEVNAMVNRYRKKLGGADEVFQLPFVVDPKASKRFAKKRQNNKSANSSLDMANKSESSCLSIHAPLLTSTDISSSLQTVNSNVNPLFASRPDKRGLSGGEEQTQTPRNVPNKGDMEHEEMGTENNYTCPLGESDLDSDEVTDSENAGNQNNLQNPKSCSLISGIPRELEASCLGICSPLLTITDVSSSLPTVNANVNPPFASQPDKRGLYGGEEETQTPRNAPIKCDMEQEEMETENNMWKLRANRVKQILSTPNKEFCSFNFSKKIGLEFNVGFGPKQNISVDSLTNSVLLELAKFALAINSSQQDFIMEILEYNFDFGLQSQHHRNLFTCEIMNRVSQLRSCEDAVKFSNEVFELPGLMPSINMSNQSVGRVNPELNSVSRMEECDFAPVCHPHSHAETKEHISQTSVDLYPFCKEIGLKLRVNSSQPNKKLDINKLTNGAMTEITNFAEKLCGTFEQICLDILGHNFDTDLQSGDSELARNILARIPAAMEKRNLSTFVKAYKKTKGTRKDSSTMAKLDCQNNPCSPDSSQAAIIDQNEGSSPDTEHQNELNLKLWKLRANHIQQILSIPHEEHCPLYSYSRCKKSGIDFNVGSGVKQNLDPKLLTNGIMVELNAFATGLISATKYFITEILEYNFNLNLKNEQDRSAFAGETLRKIKTAKAYKSSSGSRMKMPFELPDMRCTQEPTTYCPKCYQERNHKLRQDESDPGHMDHPRSYTMTATVFADGNCKAQKPAKDPSSTFSTTEETIMDSYPRCKKIGLNLCVDKDQPKDKLDTHVLTRGIIAEVTSFAKKLRGTKSKIINDLLEHNFHIAVQSRNINPIELFRRATTLNDGRLAWFSEVFVIQPYPHRQPGPASKSKEALAVQRSERMETIKKRQLALQAKEERATLPSHNINVIKAKRNDWSRVNCYPICTEIGLDLDLTSKSGDKEKLDLKLLTRAVVLEIHKFATKKVGHCFPRTVFDILNYNFDISSQRYRCWEFSIATASKFNTMVNQCGKKLDRADEVFQLPFEVDPKASQRFVKKRQNDKNANSSLDMANKSESSCMGIRAPLLTSTNVSSTLPTVNSNVNTLFASQPDKRGLCGGEVQTQTPRNAPNECDMEQEEMGAENNYTCPLGESDLDSDEVNDSGNAGNQNHLQNPESCSLISDFPRESESSCLGICVPLLTTTDVSSSLPTVNPNVNPPFGNQPDKRGLCGGEEQTQTTRNAPNKCDMEQEVMETENKMWKLRANRVKQILSTPNKEFGSFNFSKKFGLEFNVGFGPKQNISVDSLTNSVLLELAKFALAVNSSQQDFIVEILEYNFDFGLQSQHNRNLFTCEIMNRVSQLRSCEDAVKFSNEVFELPGPMPSINMSNQSVGRVNPELRSVSRMEEGDVALMCHPHSHARTKDHISQTSVDLYPFCKEIGLKLHVNNSQPNKKLDINKLTNGAMTEVTNFADKLCGTFEQICLDILGHNFDLDLQSGGSELAKNILARIPAVMEQRNMSTCVKAYKKVNGMEKDFSTTARLDCQNNPNLDACSAGSSQAAIIDQNEGSSPDTEHQNELNLKLWKLRANHIQQILSIPHEEHCPFYSYSRCKNSGIDFNVGSGVKQNLDPKLLTNGIMGELNTFATALQSATKYFITEILEYNFNLNLKNEQDRSAFAQQTLDKIRAAGAYKRNSSCRMKRPFELPDMRCIQEPTTYCPKCYQDRNHKLRQDESDPGHMTHPRPHTMADTVSADANCTAQKPAKDPSSTFSTTEETIMDSYPRCMKIGLNLCVDKDRPKDKLDTHVLTRGIIAEVTSFAKKLRGTKNKIINDVLEHNFHIGRLSQDLNPAEQFYRSAALKHRGLDWFSEVFVVKPISHREPGYTSKQKQASAMGRSDRKETIKKRKLALQAKEERATLPSHNTSNTKSKTNHRRRGNSYPLCTKIGLDLDVTSKSGDKEKLDLKLLTRAVVLEIHKFAIKKVGHSFPDTLFDILDYNFDISSQHDRQWKFSISTASKFNTTFNRYCKNPVGADEVFKLPFVSASKASQRFVEKRQNESANSSLDMASKSESSYLGIRAPFLTSTSISSSLPNVNPPFACRPGKRGLCEGEEQTQTPRNVPYEYYMEQEGMRTEHSYTCPLGESDLDSDEVTDTGSAGNQNHLQNPGSCSLISDIPRESESSHLDICVSFLTSANVSSSLPTVNSNVNPPFASKPDKRGLCGGEEQRQTPRNAPNECDMEQGEMETENNYTCPLGESDLESDEVTDTRNSGNQNLLQNPKSCSLISDIPRESESSHLGICAYFHNSTNISSSLPTVNSNVNPPFASKPDKRGLCGGEEQTQTTRNAPNECDMEQEEMETENNMWKLRANRVKQILSTLDKEFCSFNRFKKFGLEFNVGFGPKQNISVDSLTNSFLLELAKFALAINSSQQDFIMEILEYNFDFGLQSQHHRNLFTCEIMNRVSQLRSCEDAVKFSNEVFELPGLMPSINMSNQSVGRVNPELNSVSRMEECDVASVCHPHSHAETKEHISQTSVDLYPFCKEIGLKLHVNSSQPNKKLDINKLTNRAMTEVTNFADKLCGTFEQICLDILGHNFDLDLQSGDSELARNILARISAAMEKRNLSTCVKSCKKIKGTRKDSSTAKLDCQDDPNLDACSADSSQAAIRDQNDTEHLNELNLKLWKLRANHIQQILSIPHEEHCLLYSYTRCKKSGIDFNVGSGVKQNLDPKLLTNGIMVELNTFATALLSSTKYFITEILEYNFNLNLKNELDRSAFAQEILNRIRVHKRYSITRMKMPFELPDMRCIQEATYDKTTYCPKCYQERNHKHHQDESDPGHMNHPCPHTMTDIVSADANCTAQKPVKDPSSAFSTEETIMDSYPRCKKIGLNLCVDKDQPKDKLDTHVLTCAIVNEVASFAKKLRGTKSKIINDLLDHNFNIGVQSRGVNPAELFRRVTAHNDGWLAWFNEVFVIQSFSRRQPGPASKLKEALAMQRSERMETIKKRQLALQAKEERATLPSHNINVVKSKRNDRSKGNSYPICTKIGLDLDVTSKSGDKEKLDLKLLTRAVVFEIHKFATKKVGHYFPGTVFDILDYNFDLSSQHDRRWEFSIATASKVNTMVKQFRKTRDRADEVFKLPFVFAHKASQETKSAEKRQNPKRTKYSREEPDKKTNKGCVRQVRYHSDVNRVHFLDGVKTNEDPWFHDEDTTSPTDPWTIGQMNGCLVSVGCDSPLQGNIQLKEEEYDPRYGDMKPEPDTEEKYHPHNDDVKTESNTEDVEHLAPAESAGSLGYTLITMCPNSESNIKTESENEGFQYYILTESQGSEGHAMPAICPNYFVPVEAGASQGYSLITVGQGNESALIKEEQENVPADSYHYGAV